jgi:hypothetical protein
MTLDMQSLSKCRKNIDIHSDLYLRRREYISGTGNKSNNVRDPCAYLIIILKLMTIDEGRMLSGFIISCKTTSNTWALVCKRFAACILQRPITNTLESTIPMLFLV